MQIRLFLWPLVVLTGAGCLAVIVVSSLGHLGVTDRPSQLPELVASSTMLVIVIGIALIIVRMRTELHGPMLWRFYGILRPKQKILVDLNEAAEARVSLGMVGPYPTIYLHFYNADGELLAVGPGLSNFQHKDQQRFHDYMAQYVRVTGEWKLARSNFVQTSTHPPQSSS